MESLIIELANSTSIPSSSSENYTFPNSTEFKEPENVFILPWWQQLIWSFVFGTMVIVATGGNLIVIWIVLAHKRMVI